MRTSRKLVSALAISACALAASLAPAAASADTYAPGADNQDFATSSGGWGNGSGSTGLCVPAVTCPIVTNSHQTTGGAGGAGDGFIRTSIIGVASLATTTDATWTSNEFVYNGNGGAVPTSAVFTMDRQSDVTALLAVIGNLASYNVELIDTTAGFTSLTVVSPTTQAGAASWTAIPAVNVTPSQLTVGDQYVIRIHSSYTNGTGVSVLPMGSSDYDNVVLTTAGDASGGGGGGGGGGGTGTGTATGTGAGAGAGSGLSDYQQCVQNAKKKVKKKKLTASKRKKVLKKKIRACGFLKIKKKKKIKKR